MALSADDPISSTPGAISRWGCSPLWTRSIR